MRIHSSLAIVLAAGGLAGCAGDLDSDAPPQSPPPGQSAPPPPPPPPPAEPTPLPEPYGQEPAPAPSGAIAPSAPSAQPSASPPQAEPAPSPPLVSAYPTGQWVYLSGAGWVWVPAGTTTVDSDGVPYAYLYTPAYGWTWYLSPWGLGPYHYGVWIRHPWHPVGMHGYWVARPHVVVRLGGGGRRR
jgi:hypothetical protein